MHHAIQDLNIYSNTAIECEERFKMSGNPTLHSESPSTCSKKIWGLLSASFLVCMVGECLGALPSSDLAADDLRAGVERRKREFLVQMADAWRHAGYPVSWKHAEWKHDEIEPNWTGAVAALWLKRSPAETRRATAFLEAMPLDEKIDPDMRVCQALHAYYLFRDEARVNCFQHKNVVLGRGAAGEAYLATEEFDEVVEQNGWIFLRTAEAFVACRVVGCSYTWLGVKHPSVFGDFIRFEKADAPFILEVAEAEDYGKDFDRFQADVADNRIELQPDGVSYESCTQGRAGPSAERFVATLRYGELPLLDGSRVQLQAYGMFESPYLFSDWDSGIVVLRCDPERMTVNVTRPRAPLRIEETIKR